MSKSRLLRGVACKQTRELLHFLQDEGCELVLTGSMHVKVKYEGRTVGLTSYTTSDHRAYMRIRSDFRKAVPQLMERFTK